MIRPQTCPICGTELDAKAGSHSNLFPFCSVRCQQVDFFRWCEGKYAIVEPLNSEVRDQGSEIRDPASEKRTDADPDF